MTDVLDRNIKATEKTDKRTAKDSQVCKVAGVVKVLCISCAVGLEASISDLARQGKCEICNDQKPDIKQ